MSERRGELKHPRIVIDALFYQMGKTGIARLWTSYLERWANSEFASHLVVLDRQKTAPRFAGITYRDVPAFNVYESGKEMLQAETWCRELQADVFLSTFYSTPIETKSVMMVYDMIYELQSGGVVDWWDQEEKSLAILHASHIVAISHSTANDVHSFYPHLSEEKISVVHCGVDPAFSPATPEIVSATKGKFELKKPYFLLVGTRKGFRGYKNAAFLVRTVDQMKRAEDYEIVCVGGEKTLEELAAFKNATVRLLPHVSEADLIALYSGAEAFVCPSRYEGFGLPLIEAMACGCPVIACPNGSIPEVAGNAALFVANDDDRALEEALLKVGNPAIREDMRAKGFRQKALFSWEKAADELAQVLLRAADLPGKSAKEIRIWKELREKESRLATLLGKRTLPGRQLKLKLGRFNFNVGVSKS